MSAPLPHAAAAWCAAALAAAVATLAGTQPAPLLAAAGALAAWRALARAPARPPAWLRGLIALGATGAVLAVHGTLRGLEAGSALLLAGAALKLLELGGRRDAVVVVSASALLVAAGLLHDPELPRPLAAAAALWLIVAALAGVCAPEEPPRRLLRRAAALLAQAAPLALVLFVLFPRLEGPLWGGARPQARTGLGGDLELGRVAELARSREVAMRVRFHGPVPPPAERYWRAAVLWDTDGRRWRRGAAPAAAPEGAATPAYRYTVTLLPYGGPWLPALDRVVASDTGLLAGDAVLSWTRPVDRVLVYRAASASPPREDPGSGERRRALRLPAVRPRVAALAARLRREGGDDAGTMAAALAWYARQGFIYTLRPGPVRGDPVETFLFERRRGFCEHFAASFAILMRAAGVPARLVTGYLGGEANPLTGELVLRAADAHAWVEVALPGRGWVRVDPTVTVAPQRLARSIDPADDDGPVRFVAPERRFAEALVRLRDAAGAAWTRWVLGYGPRAQEGLLAALGLAGASPRPTLALLLAVAATFAVALAAWWVLRRPRAGADAVRTAWERFRRRCARAGVIPRPGEGPLAYGRRAAAALPRHGAEIEAIVALYLDVRYGPRPPPDGAVRLARAVRRFRPRAV